MGKIVKFILVLLTLSGNAQNLRDLYQEGLRAHEEKNYTLFLDKMLQIDSLRPNYPAVVYNIVAGYSLTENHAKAMARLRSYMRMDAGQDFTQDTDFATLIEQDGFSEIEALQSSLSQELPVTKAYNWPIQHSHPESITFSDKMKAYLIGGVRDGKIWSIKEGKEPEIFAETSENSWSIMGLEVSPDGRCLWVCTTSMENYSAYHKDEQGHASILKYDLRNGKLLDSQTISGGHNFGDLIIDAKGNVYVSDGMANKIYWINPETEKLEEWVDVSESIFNLQGITFNEDESAIYMSDYIDGIYRVSLESREIIRLTETSDDILIKGIDGLYFQDNALIALHNGTRPNRVVRYRLSEDGNSILSGEVISQAGILGEPTQGVYVKDTFYYITNSPWGHYDQDGNFNPQGESIIIGKIE